MTRSISARASSGFVRAVRYSVGTPDRVRSEVPERRVALPEARAGAVKCLCRWRKRQIIGLLAGKFTEPVKGAGCPVHLAHGFQQQILQGGGKIFSHEQAVAGGKQVNVRIGNVASQANDPSR